MSPPPSGVNAQLRQLIHYHLDNGFLENAVFLAGRLHALEPRSADASHLIALCNLRLGRYKAAFDYSKSKGLQSQHLGCAYIFAQACLALEKYDLGAQALEKARNLWAGRNHWNKHSETSRRHVPDAAACYCMLGKLYAAHGDTQKAIDNFVASLKINSFMWDAFTGLCDLGALVRPHNIFKITPDMLASIPHGPQNGVDPFNPSSRQVGDVGLNLGGSNLLSRLNGSHPITNGTGPTCQNVETPIANGQDYHDEDVMMGEAGEPPRMRPITSRSRTKTIPESDQTDIPRPINQNGHKRTVSGHSTQHVQLSNAQANDPTAAPPRRSVRLLNSVTQTVRGTSRLANASSKDPETKERRELRKMKATGTKGKTGMTSTVGRVVSGNRKPPIDISDSKPDSRPASAAAFNAPPPRMAPPADTAREQEALTWSLGLLLKIGSGYKHLSRFDSRKALEAFAAVPTGQRETPWVLAQMGKACYERGDYLEAENVFKKIREKAPSWMEHMEVYSNTLWQLRREVPLSHLAHTLMDQDRLSPQAWCALGNANSLDRQHDDAIRCFSRATQLDPKFAYAFTLQGHEHVTNEEFDKAMAAFRGATSADHRHYNGWYGLGNVYERLGKFDVAEKHYREAARINPNNAMILVRIGMMLDRLKKTEPALMQFESALKLDPMSKNARFRKAQVLLKLEAPEESLQDLLVLKDIAPDDPNVHFMLGRCYKKLHDRANAVRHLTIAMNLDPKSHGIVKEVLESFDQEDEGGWSSEDDR
ncbi:nuclear protein bima [Setomelanomma holmii]|uniref:Nuclear protein bima n=1 Tax=Setomelanomma holmii TaxID=210430 RepID=A0A9P4LJ27_9PLEO|nr:nuclear protein bima [Setomelanomma holmii]